MSEPVDRQIHGTHGSAPLDAAHPGARDRPAQAQEAQEAQQVQHVHLRGAHLPAVWAVEPHWCILETGFGLGLNFLATWHAWRLDPQRPALLHFVSIDALPVAAEDLLGAAESHAHLLPLAQQLAAQWCDWSAGTHRLSLEAGQVLLTLCVGPVQPMLRGHAFIADSIFLERLSLQQGDAIGTVHTLKAVTRHARRGTTLTVTATSSDTSAAMRDALGQCGFVVRKMPNIAFEGDSLQATFAPAWVPRSARGPVLHVPRGRHASQVALVVGGGLAGAAVANSLARRGWRVHVLDRAAGPAAGTSSLPAGIFAPHVSADDALLSQLSRVGIRATLSALRQRVDAGTAEPQWAADGVCEHRPDGAVWHATAGWACPATLVRALLAHANIEFTGNTYVARLARCNVPADTEANGRWQTVDAQGNAIGACPNGADIVVLAAGFDSIALLDDVALPLAAVRGTVSIGPALTAGMPAFPVNGHGSLVPRAPTASGAVWVAGATFEREQSALPLSRAEQLAAHRETLAKMHTLLPGCLGITADDPTLRAWSGVRCTTPDRLPAVGPLPARAGHDRAGVWLCTGMGSRGLTFAVLCGEILAARLMGEPLPVDDRLAWAIAAERWAPASGGIAAPMG